VSSSENDENLPNKGRDIERAGEPVPSEEIIPPELQKLDKPELVQILVKLMRFQGPLQYPPAEIVEGWERFFPGIFRKLVEQSELQTKHRQKLEIQRAQRAEARADTGQILMFTIAIVGLCASAVVGIYGSAFVGCVLAVVSVGGPAAATAIANGWGQKPPS